MQHATRCEYRIPHYGVWQICWLAACIAISFACAVCRMGHAQRVRASAPSPIRRGCTEHQICLNALAQFVILCNIFQLPRFYDVLLSHYFCGAQKHCFSVFRMCSLSLLLRARSGAGCRRACVCVCVHVIHAVHAAMLSPFLRIRFSCLVRGCILLFGTTIGSITDTHTHTAQIECACGCSATNNSNLPKRMRVLVW